MWSSINNTDVPMEKRDKNAASKTLTRFVVKNSTPRWYSRTRNATDTKELRSICGWWDEYPNHIVPNAMLIPRAGSAVLARPSKECAVSLNPCKPSTQHTSASSMRSTASQAVASCICPLMTLPHSKFEDITLRIDLSFASSSRALVDSSDVPTM
jgi:hypothetical protein